MQNIILFWQLFYISKTNQTSSKLNSSLIVLYLLIQYEFYDCIFFSFSFKYSLSRRLCYEKRLLKIATTPVISIA